MIDLFSLPTPGIAPEFYQIKKSAGLNGFIESWYLKFGLLAFNRKIAQIYINELQNEKLRRRYLRQSSPNLLILISFIKRTTLLLHLEATLPKRIMKLWYAPAIVEAEKK